MPSCSKAVSDWRELDASHFLPQAAADLLFDKRNVNNEGKYDNEFDENLPPPFEGRKDQEQLATLDERT
jgi:hypothetical protein